MNHTFKVGDKVTFINEFGVVFPNHIVTSLRKFTEEDRDFMPDRVIYIDTDCYWFPKEPNRLILSSEATTIREMNTILKVRGETQLARIIAK